MPQDISASIQPETSANAALCFAKALAKEDASIAQKKLDLVSVCSFLSITTLFGTMETKIRLTIVYLRMTSLDSTLGQDNFQQHFLLQEDFHKAVSRRRQQFCEEVKECCASARTLLRQVIGAAQADLGILAEHLRLAEQHEKLLSDPPDPTELHRLEDELISARDLYEDNLEKERRLEREHNKVQRRGQSGEVGPISADFSEAQAITARSKKLVQQAESALHTRLIDLVQIKRAPWGLPELHFDIDEEHLNAVDVLTPNRRCADYEDLLPLGTYPNIFTAVYIDEPCVLKELRSMTQSGALRREVLHRKKLNHPLIVPVLAAFEEEDKGRSIAYLHMPRYSCNLEEWCSSDSCTLPKMRQVLRDLVLVVAYVHSQNVVHGDLKPSNFLMDAEERPCLTDFETSQCLDGRRAHKTTMFVGGTSGFVPPEWSPQTSPTAASDIYSLGCICEHLLQRWQKWPQGNEQRKAIAKVVKKMKSHQSSDRPTAVEVLECMTAAMKTTAGIETLPLYWKNDCTLKCEVKQEDVAEWQSGLTTFQQLQAALLNTVHDGCCLSHV